VVLKITVERTRLTQPRPDITTTLTILASFTNSCHQFSSLSTIQLTGLIKPALPVARTTGCLQAVTTAPEGLRAGTWLTGCYARRNPIAKNTVAHSSFPFQISAHPGSSCISEGELASDINTSENGDPEAAGAVSGMNIKLTMDKMILCLFSQSSQSTF